jgi:hypothetical protein
MTPSDRKPARRREDRQVIGRRARQLRLFFHIQSPAGSIADKNVDIRGDVYCRSFFGYTKFVLRFTRG